MQNEAEIIHQQFLNRVSTGDVPECDDGMSLSDSQLLQQFKSQLISRHLDLQSRKMQAKGESFYTIGSAGHEGNAAIAAAFKHTDTAFLHYRDAAFMIERSNQVVGQNVIRDMLLSFAASSDDPISGGRHKVLGSKALNIPPQTSTIASHLPKAVGAATSIGLNRRLKREGEMPSDSIVICSFGDASLNHSTAQGAINTASWMAYQKRHLPIVFVCEDNDIGISVPTPQGWVAAQMQGKPAIHYIACDGLNLADTYRAACEAEAYVRKTRMPVFLHMKCVRLMGHAGSDVQRVYLEDAAVDAINAHDPLLYSAGLVMRRGLMTSKDVVALYQSIESEIEKEAVKAAKSPKLKNAKEVMNSIVPPKKEATKVASKNMDKTFHSANKNAVEKPVHMSRLINLALHELMHEHEHIIIAGEDVGRKGGVYGVTTKLQQTFGAHRVIDTLLDEQSILGLGIGLAHNNLLPIVEIQFLAYLHNAEDQLRGEAATLSFFSKGQYTNPMVIRIAGLAYQRGFGGHFHNDNSFAVLRDIPGMIVACPSNGSDAVGMLRECVRLAEEEQRVVVFLEPIAQYVMRDLHEEKDEKWCSNYADARAAKMIKLGDVHQHGKGKDLCILTYGNGYYLSRQAAKELEASGIALRVIDLRWLHPLPEKEILKAVKDCAHVLIVDECRKTGSISEAIMALLMEQMEVMPKTARVCAEDSFIPLGKAATLTLPSKESIVSAAKELVEDQTSLKISAA